jgi:hypothetical protein
VNDGGQAIVGNVAGGGRVAEKTAINPMHLSKRCKAHSKRTGLPCGSPAVDGWNVCRMHGARGGAPKGRGNGNYRHGARTRDTMAATKAVRALARLCQQTIAEIEGD